MNIICKTSKIAASLYRFYPFTAHSLLVTVLLLRYARLLQSLQRSISSNSTSNGFGGEYTWLLVADRTTDVFPIKQTAYFYTIFTMN